MTRFSDETFGVFYASLELATCKREVEFHVNCEIVENESESLSFTRYYYLITCDYAWNTANLRGFERKYAELTSIDESGYSFCQTLELNAKRMMLDGLFTPSARLAGGTCVPVLENLALSKPSIEDEVALRASDGSVRFQNE